MEELKIILDSLIGLGDGAKAAFILWVCVKYALAMVLKTVCYLALFFTIFKIFSPLVKNLSLYSEIKSEMGMYGDLTTPKKRRVLDAVRRGKDQPEA